MGGVNVNFNLDFLSSDPTTVSTTRTLFGASRAGLPGSLPVWYARFRPYKNYQVGNVVQKVSSADDFLDRNSRSKPDQFNLYVCILKSASYVTDSNFSTYFKSFAALADDYSISESGGLREVDAKTEWATGGIMNDNEICLNLSEFIEMKYLVCYSCLIPKEGSPKDPIQLRPVSEISFGGGSARTASPQTAGGQVVDRYIVDYPEYGFGDNDISALPDRRFGFSSTSLNAVMGASFDFLDARMSAEDDISGSRQWNPGVSYAPGDIVSFNPPSGVGDMDNLTNWAEAFNLVGFPSLVMCKKAVGATKNEDGTWNSTRAPWYGSESANVSEYWVRYDSQINRPNSSLASIYKYFSEKKFEIKKFAHSSSYQPGQLNLAGQAVQRQAGRIRMADFTGSSNILGHLLVKFATPLKPYWREHCRTWYSGASSESGPYQDGGYDVFIYTKTLRKDHGGQPRLAITFGRTTKLSSYRSTSGISTYATSRIARSDINRYLRGLSPSSIDADLDSEGDLLHFQYRSLVPFFYMGRGYVHARRRGGVHPGSTKGSRQLGKYIMMVEDVLSRQRIEFVTPQIFSNGNMHAGGHGALSGMSLDHGQPKTYVDYDYTLSANTQDEALTDLLSIKTVTGSSSVSGDNPCHYLILGNKIGRADQIENEGKRFINSHVDAAFLPILKRTDQMSDSEFSAAIGLLQTGFKGFDGKKFKDLTGSQTSVLSDAVEGNLLDFEARHFIDLGKSDLQQESIFSLTIDRTGSPQGHAQSLVNIPKWDDTKEYSGGNMTRVPREDWWEETTAVTCDAWRQEKVYSEWANQGDENNTAYVYQDDGAKTYYKSLKNGNENFFPLHPHIFFKANVAMGASAYNDPISGQDKDKWTRLSILKDTAISPLSMVTQITLYDGWVKIFKSSQTGLSSSPSNNKPGITLGLQWFNSLGAESGLGLMSERMYDIEPWSMEQAEDYKVGDLVTLKEGTPTVVDTNSGESLTYEQWIALYPTNENTQTLDSAEFLFLKADAAVPSYCFQCIKDTDSIASPPGVGIVPGIFPRESAGEVAYFVANLAEDLQYSRFKGKNLYAETTWLEITSNEFEEELIDPDVDPVINEGRGRAYAKYYGLEELGGKFKIKQRDLFGADNYAYDLTYENYYRIGEAVKMADDEWRVKIKQFCYIPDATLLLNDGFVLEEDVNSGTVIEGLQYKTDIDGSGSPGYDGKKIYKFPVSINSGTISGFASNYSLIIRPNEYWQPVARREFDLDRTYPSLEQIAAGVEPQYFLTEGDFDFIHKAEGSSEYAVTKAFNSGLDIFGPRLKTYSSSGAYWTSRVKYPSTNMIEVWDPNNGAPAANDPLFLASLDYVNVNYDEWSVDLKAEDDNLSLSDLPHPLNEDVADGDRHPAIQAFRGWVDSIDSDIDFNLNSGFNLDGRSVGEVNPIKFVKVDESYPPTIELTTEIYTAGVADTGHPYHQAIYDGGEIRINSNQIIKLIPQLKAIDGTSFTSYSGFVSSMSNANVLGKYERQPIVSGDSYSDFGLTYAGIIKSEYVQVGEPPYYESKAYDAGEQVASYDGYVWEASEAILEGEEPTFAGGKWEFIRPLTMMSRIFSEQLLDSDSLLGGIGGRIEYQYEEISHKNSSILRVENNGSNIGLLEELGDKLNETPKWRNISGPEGDILPWTFDQTFDTGDFTKEANILYYAIRPSAGIQPSVVGSMWKKVEEWENNLPYKLGDIVFAKEEGVEWSPDENSGNLPVQNELSQSNSVTMLYSCLQDHNSSGEASGGVNPSPENILDFTHGESEYLLRPFDNISNIFTNSGLDLDVSFEMQDFDGQSYMSSTKELTLAVFSNENSRKDVDLFTYAFNSPSVLKGNLGFVSEFKLGNSFSGLKNTSILPISVKITNVTGTAANVDAETYLDINNAISKTYAVSAGLGWKNRFMISDGKLYASGMDSSELGYLGISNYEKVDGRYETYYGSNLEWNLSTFGRHNMCAPLKDAQDDEQQRVKIYTNGTTDTPLDPEPDIDFVRSGGGNTVFITADKELYGFGKNENNSLGITDKSLNSSSDDPSDWGDWSHDLIDSEDRFDLLSYANFNHSAGGPIANNKGDPHLAGWAAYLKSDHNRANPSPQWERMAWAAFPLDWFAKTSSEQDSYLYNDVTWIPETGVYPDGVTPWWASQEQLKIAGRILPWYDDINFWKEGGIECVGFDKPDNRHENDVVNDHFILSSEDYIPFIRTSISGAEYSHALELKSPSGSDYLDFSIMIKPSWEFHPLGAEALATVEGIYTSERRRNPIPAGFEGAKEKHMAGAAVLNDRGWMVPTWLFPYRDDEAESNALISWNGASWAHGGFESSHPTSKWGDGDHLNATREWGTPDWNERSWWGPDKKYKGESLIWSTWGSDESYDGPYRVKHLGEKWIPRAGVSPGDEPGVSDKWEYVSSPPLDLPYGGSHKNHCVIDYFHDDKTMTISGTDYLALAIYRLKDRANYSYMDRPTQHSLNNNDSDNLRANCLKLAANRNAPGVPLPAKLTDDNVVWATTNAHSTIYITEDGDVKILGSIVGCKDIPVQGLDFHSDATHGEVRQAHNVTFHAGDDSFDSLGDLTVDKLWQNDNWGLIHHMTDRDPDPFAGGEVGKYGSLIQGNINYGETWEPYIQNIDYISGQYASYEGSLWGKTGDQDSGDHSFPGVISGEWSSISENTTTLVTQAASSLDFSNLNDNYLHKYWPNTGPAYVATDSNGENPDARRVGTEDWGSIEFFGGNVIRQDGTIISDPSVGIAGTYKKDSSIDSPASGYSVYRHVTNTNNLIWFYNGVWRASTIHYYSSGEYDKQYAKGAVTTTVDKTPADVAVWSVLTERESHQEISIHNTGAQWDPFEGQYSSDSHKDTAWHVQPEGVLPPTTLHPLWPAASIPNNLIPGNWLEAPEGSNWVGVWWSEQGGVPTLWPQATPVFYQAFHLDEGIDVSQVTMSFDFAVDNTVLDIEVHSGAGWHSINPDLVSGEEWETTSYLTNWDFNKSMLGFGDLQGSAFPSPSGTLFGWRPLFPDNWTANTWMWPEDTNIPWTISPFDDYQGADNLPYWWQYGRKPGAAQSLPAITTWGTFFSAGGIGDVPTGATVSDWVPYSNYGSNVQFQHGMHYPGIPNSASFSSPGVLEVHLDAESTSGFEYLDSLLDKKFADTPASDGPGYPSIADLACMGIYHYKYVLCIFDNCPSWGSVGIGNNGNIRAYGAANYYWGLQTHATSSNISEWSELHLVPWGYDYIPTTVGFATSDPPQWGGGFSPDDLDEARLGTWDPDANSGAGDYVQYHQGSALSGAEYGPNSPQPLIVGQEYEVHFYHRGRPGYAIGQLRAQIHEGHSGPQINTLSTRVTDNVSLNGEIMVGGTGSGNDQAGPPEFYGQRWVGEQISGSWRKGMFAFVATHASHSIKFSFWGDGSDSTAFIHGVRCKPVATSWQGGWFGALNSISIGPQGIGGSNIFRAGAGAAGDNALVVYTKNMGETNNPAGLLLTNLVVNAPLLLGYGNETWTVDAGVKTEYRIQHRAGNGASGKLSTNMVTGTLPYPLADYAPNPGGNYNGYTWYGDQTDWDHYINTWPDVAAEREENYPWMLGEEFAKLHWVSIMEEADRANRHTGIRHKSTLERRTLAKSEWFRNTYTSQTYMRDWVEDSILGHTFLARGSQAANAKLTLLGKTGGDWYYTAKYGQWIYVTDLEKTKKEDGERFECFMSGIDIDFTEISSDAEHYGVGNALFPVIDGEIVGKLAFTGTGTGAKKDSGIFFHIYVRPSSGIVLRTIKPEILTQGKWGVMYSPGKTTDTRTAGDWSTIVQTRYGMISYNDHRVVWSILDDGPPDVRAYADGVAGETGTGYDQGKVMAASAWTWPENNGGGHHEDLDPPLVLAQGYHTFYMWEHDFGGPWGILGDEGKFRYLLSAEIGGAAVNEEFHDSGDIVFHAGWILDNDAIYGPNLPGIGSWENHIEYSPRGFSGFFDYTTAAGMGEDPEYQGSTISKSSYNEGDIVTAQVADGDDLFGTLVFVSMKDDNTSDIGFSESLERVDAKKWSMPAPKAITRTYDFDTNTVTALVDTIDGASVSPVPHTLYNHLDYNGDKALQVEAGEDHILIRTADGKAFGVGDNSLQQIDWRNKTGGMESDFDLGDRLGRGSDRGFYKLGGTASSSLNPIYDSSWNAIEQPALPPEKWAYGKTYQHGSQVWIDHVSHVIYVGPGEDAEGTLLQEHLQVSIPSLTENGELESLSPEALKSDWGDTGKLGKWQKPDVEVLTFGSIGEAMDALSSQENGVNGTFGSTGLFGWFPLGELAMTPNDGATHSFPSSEIKTPRTGSFKLYKKAFGDTYFCTREVFLRPHLISHGNSNNAPMELNEIAAVSASGNNSLILSQSGNLFGTGENKVSGPPGNEYEGRTLGNVFGLESEFLDGPEFIFPNVEFISLQGDCATFISEGRSYKCSGVGLRPYLENYSFKGAPAIIFDDATGREGKPIIAKQVFMDSFGFWSKSKRRIRKWPQFIDSKLCRKGSKDIRDKLLPEINRLADAWVSNKSYQANTPSGRLQYVTGQQANEAGGMPVAMMSLTVEANAVRMGSAFIGRDPDFVTHKGMIYQCTQDHYLSFEPGTPLGEPFWRQSTVSMINVNPIQHFYEEWQLDRWATMSYVDEDGKLFSRGFQVMYAPDVAAAGSHSDIIGGTSGGWAGSYTSLRSNASTWADERISGWHLDLEYSAVEGYNELTYGGIDNTQFLYFGGEGNEFLGNAGSVFGESLNLFYGNNNTNIVNEHNLLDTEYVDFTHNLLGSLVSGDNRPTAVSGTWANMISHVVNRKWSSSSCGWGETDPFAPSFIRDFNPKSWPATGKLDLLDMYENASAHGWGNYYYPGDGDPANNSKNPPDGMFNWWQVMYEMETEVVVLPDYLNRDRGALNAFKFMNRFTGDDTYAWAPAGSTAEISGYHPDIKWSTHSKIERYDEAPTDSWGKQSNDLNGGASWAHEDGYSIFGGNFNDRFNDENWVVGELFKTKSQSAQFGIKDEAKNPRLTESSGRGSLTKFLGLQVGELTEGCPTYVEGGINDNVYSLLLTGHREYARVNLPATAMFGAWMCDPCSLPFGNKINQSWRSQTYLRTIGEPMSWNANGLLGEDLSGIVDIGFELGEKALKPGDRFNFDGTVYRMHWRVEETPDFAPIPHDKFIDPDRDGPGGTGYSSMWSVDRLEKEHRWRTQISTMHQVMADTFSWAADPYDRPQQSFGSSIGHSQIYTGFAERIGGHCTRPAWSARDVEAGKVSLAVDYRNYSAGIDQRQPDNFSGLGEFDVFDVPGWNQRTSDNKETIELTDTQGYTFANRESGTAFWQRYVSSGWDSIPAGTQDWVSDLDELYNNSWTWWTRFRVYHELNNSGYPSFTIGAYSYSASNPLPGYRVGQGSPHATPGISNYFYWTNVINSAPSASINRYTGHYKFPQRAVDFGFGPITDIMEAYGQLKRYGMSNFTVGPEEAHSWAGRENQIDSYCAQSKRSFQYDQLVVKDLINIPIGELVDWLWENHINAGDLICIEDPLNPTLRGGVVGGRRLWRAYEDIESGTIKGQIDFDEDWWRDLFQEIKEWDKDTWYSSGDRVIYKGTLWIVPAVWEDSTTPTFKGLETMPATAGDWREDMNLALLGASDWVIDLHNLKFSSGTAEERVTWFLAVWWDVGTYPSFSIDGDSYGPENKLPNFFVAASSPYTTPGVRNYEYWVDYLTGSDPESQPHWVEGDHHSSAISQPPKDFVLYSAKDMIENWEDRPYTARHNRELRFELAEKLVDIAEVDEFDPTAGEEKPEIWIYEADSEKDYEITFPGYGAVFSDAEWKENMQHYLTAYGAMKGGNIAGLDDNHRGGPWTFGDFHGFDQHPDFEQQGIYYNSSNWLCFRHPWRMFLINDSWGEHGKVDPWEWANLVGPSYTSHTPYYVNNASDAATSPPQNVNGSGPNGESLYRNAHPYSYDGRPPQPGDVIINHGDLFLGKNAGEYEAGSNHPSTWARLWAFHCPTTEYSNSRSEHPVPTPDVVWDQNQAAVAAGQQSGAWVREYPDSWGDGEGDYEMNGRFFVTDSNLPGNYGFASDQHTKRLYFPDNAQPSASGDNSNYQGKNFSGGVRIREPMTPNYFRGDLVKIGDSSDPNYGVWRLKVKGGSAVDYGDGANAPGGTSNIWEYVGGHGDTLGYLLIGAKGAFYSESYLDSGNKRDIDEWYINPGSESSKIRGSTYIYDSEDMSITCRGSKMFASRDAAINWVIRRAKEREKLGFSWYDHKTRKWVAGRNWLWENINLERVWDYGGWELSEGGKPEGAGDNAWPWLAPVDQSPRTQYYPGDRAWWKGELYECQPFLRLLSTDFPPGGSSWSAYWTWGPVTGRGLGELLTEDANAPWNAYNPEGRWRGTPANDSEFPYTDSSLPDVDGEHAPPWWVKSGGGTFKLPLVGFDDYDGSYDDSKHQGDANVREGSNLAGTMSIFPNDYFDTQEEAEAFARNPQVASNYSDSDTFQPGGPYKGHPGFTDADLIEITTEYCDKYGAAGVDGDCEVIYIGGAAHSQCLARMRGICDSWEEKIGNALPGGTIIPNGELFLSMLGSAKWKDSWEDTGNKVDTD